MIIQFVVKSYHEKKYGFLDFVESKKCVCVEFFLNQKIKIYKTIFFLKNFQKRSIFTIRQNSTKFVESKHRFDKILSNQTYFLTFSWLSSPCFISLKSKIYDYSVRG
jgi:hypothetical protein